jgi:purine nucleosidase
MRIHLDTDLGGDPDDVCALAMLLGWPEVEVTGITTAIDPAGRRAGYVAHCLDLAGRPDIPLAAGATLSLTSLRPADPVIGDERYWPAEAAPLPSAPGAALDLLAASIDRGATVVAIGPMTNLALLEIVRPGILRGTSVVAMGGWVDPPAEGLPAWGPEMDWNVQWDTRAAEIVAGACRLTLATLPATLGVWLRAGDLPRLRAAGRLGELIARQSQAWADEAGFRDLGTAHPGLPDDLLNFHYDPAACAVALGWPGAVVEERLMRTTVEEGVVHFDADPGGRPIRVVVRLDGEAFAQTWLSAVEVACARGR